MTLDEQLAALRPLTPGAVATLAGYANHSRAISTLRHRGKPLSIRRLLALAIGLRAIANKAEEITGITFTSARHS